MPLFFVIYIKRQFLEPKSFYINRLWLFSEVNLYAKLLGTSFTTFEKVFTPANCKGVTNVFETATKEITSFSKHFGKRIEALQAYKSPAERTKLFNFCANGEINVLDRAKGSSDLAFLDHVKTGNYTHPQINPEGTYKASKSAIEQSNKLAKEIITENDKLVDGFRYHGPNAKFDETGKDVSMFKNGGQEITIIDRNADAKLAQTIKTFQTRISGKNLSEQEKINELLKYVDEVFSVKASGSQIEALVNNMHSSGLNTKEVMLGDIINSGAGLCRHRSLLTKVIGDEVGLKTAIVQGHYSGGGHAWNEITTKNGEKILFDAMHGSTFNVSNTSKSVMPQVFNYKIDDPKNADKLISKYFNPDDAVGLVYRNLAHGQDLKINNICEITPSNTGGAKFTINPSGSEEIFVNGHIINSPTQLHVEDWVQIKSLGFQIL